MKKIISIIYIIIIVLLHSAFAQNNAPEVDNVTFTQRDDGSFMVDIYYDITDADGDTMFVTMQVSADAGITWDFACDSLTGNVGDSILSGTGKHIIWDFGTEHPETFGDLFQIKIIANDGVYNGTLIDIDGNVYQTIKIGDQWWMAENLKVTHYCNGDAIPNVTDNEEWRDLITGAYCNYDNNESSVETYGRLYNGYAVHDSGKIAPDGWHVPTDEEWIQLEMHLGMNPLETHAHGWRGTDEGGKLKEAGTGHWSSPNAGATNESGFTALPGGWRFTTGQYVYINYEAFFWTSIEHATNHNFFRHLDNDSASISRTSSNNAHGYSVRCVRDIDYASGSEIDWVTVPAGEYTYGSEDSVKIIEYDYQVSKYEITNAQYVVYLQEAFANGDITVSTTTVQGYYAGDDQWSAGTYEYLDLDDSDCRIDYTGGSFIILFGYENHPVFEVTWFGANAYAEHYGYRLPTEHEWEKTSRANTGFIYPWGDEIDGSRANYYNSGDPFENYLYSGTTPVGYYDGFYHQGFQTTDSPSQYGAYDMAGNVWELTNSFYGSTLPSYRIIRGGSWTEESTVLLQSWYRKYFNPTYSEGNVGFRIARNL